MGDGSTILQARDVVVERGDETILDGVSLTVTAATRMLVRGRSGAGKTTLFQILGLLAPPTHGEVRVRGENVTALSERRRAALRRDAIGIVFQDLRLVPDLTARENAALPQVHGEGRDDAWLDELFERLDITPLADAYPATLSGGERQRVAIARALAARPEVVLADEPTGQLDPETADRVTGLLLELQAATDTALVVISHERGLADRFETVRTLADGTLS